jgi:3-deoxy-D-arabino-heptulosonate 7-phosphate (DAHP) synthase
LKKQSFFGIKEDGNITFIETKGNKNTFSVINMTDYNEEFEGKIVINRIEIMEIENYLKKENISGFIINQFDKEMINKIQSKITINLNKYNKNIFEKIYDNYM